jgi:hypothetical protein
MSRYAVSGTGLFGVVSDTGSALGVSRRLRRPPKAGAGNAAVSGIALLRGGVRHRVYYSAWCQLPPYLSMTSNLRRADGVWHRRHSGRGVWYRRRLMPFSYSPTSTTYITTSNLRRADGVCHRRRSGGERGVWHRRCVMAFSYSITSTTHITTSMIHITTSIPI